MLIPIQRGSSETVARQIVSYIRRAIEAGRLAPGAKLAPIRELARTLGVNRETVASAYRELEGLGLTKSSVGRGTFVCMPEDAAAGPADAAGTAEPRPFEPVLSRASLAALPRVADYAAPPSAVRMERLVPDRSLYPHEAFRRHLNQAILEGGAALFEYGDPRGLPALRELIVERLARDGIEAGVDEVVVTAGATQALALAFRAYCDPGDAIAVESPTYAGAMSLIDALGARAIPVGLARGGIDLDRLETVLARGDVRLVYTIPTFQNPTGGSTDAEHRRALLALCGQHDVPIVEDDFEKDLRARGRPTPSLRALDRRGLVAYVGSFSKVLFPGIRIGWLLAPRGVADACTALKRGLDLTVSPLMQAGLARFIRAGELDRHMRRVVAEVRVRLDASDAAFARWLPEGSIVHPADGGYLRWVELPDGIDSAALLPAAKQAGVVYAPGEQFFTDRRRTGALRFSLSQAAPAEIERGIRALGEVAREALAGSGRSAHGDAERVEV